MAGSLLGSAGASAPAPHRRRHASWDRMARRREREGLGETAPLDDSLDDPLLLAMLQECEERGWTCSIGVSQPSWDAEGETHPVLYEATVTVQGFNSVRVEAREPLKALRAAMAGAAASGRH
jgi:hypothetical protein